MLSMYVLSLITYTHIMCLSCTNYLSTCLPACLTNLLTNLTTYYFPSHRVHVHVHPYTYLPTYHVHGHVPTYLPIMYISMYLPTYLPAFLPTYVPIYIPSTYLPSYHFTFPCTYLPTYHVHTHTLGFYSVEFIAMIPCLLLYLGWDRAMLPVLSQSCVLLVLSQIPKRFIWRHRPYMVSRAKMVCHYMYICVHILSSEGHPQGLIIIMHLPLYIYLKTLCHPEALLMGVVYARARY